MSGSVLLRFLDTPIARKAFNAVQHFKVGMSGLFPRLFRNRLPTVREEFLSPTIPIPRHLQREEELDDEEQFALLRLHSWLGRSEKVDSRTIWLDDAQRAYLRSFTSKRIPEEDKVCVEEDRGWGCSGVGYGMSGSGMCMACRGDDWTQAADCRC